MAISIRIKRSHGLATGRDIVNLLGPLDHEIISALLRTGTSIEDIEIASLWLDENHHTLTTANREMGEKMRRVYEILDYARHNATKRE